MDSLSEFWKNVKERVRNPLIFSFIVLWLLYNWKISIGLFFMDANDFRLNGHNSLYQYLESEIVDLKFAAPFLGAIIYCLAVPIVKELIRSFNALVSKYGSRLYFRISEDSKVSFDQYMEQIRILDQKTKDIDSLLGNAKKKDGERQKVSVELENLKAQYEIQGKQLVDHQEIVARMRDVKVMNGVWQVLKTVQGETTESEAVIYDGKYLTADDESTLENFFYDHRSKSISFHRLIPNGTPRRDVSIYTLTVDNPFIVRGNQDGALVKFRRIESREVVQAYNELKIAHRERQETIGKMYKTTNNKDSFWKS